MKVISVVVFLVSFNLLAGPTQGIICRDDRRMEQGSLRELVLTPKDEAYTVQSQVISSLHSSDIKVSNWSEKLTCRFDEKSALAFCQNQGGQTTVQVKGRSEFFYDSLKEEDKKKSTKYTDISLYENGVKKQTETFNASHCQVFGGES